MMNEEEMTITESETENQTNPIKPKRTDAEKLRECYKSVNGFKSRKPPTRIRDRLSTKAYWITTPKSQSLKARSF